MKGRTSDLNVFFFVQIRLCLSDSPSFHVCHISWKQIQYVDVLKTFKFYTISSLCHWYFKSPRWNALLAAAVYLTFTSMCVFDTRRLFYNLFADGGTFLCAHLEIWLERCVIMWFWTKLPINVQLRLCCWALEVPVQITDVLCAVFTDNGFLTEGKYVFLKIFRGNL